MDSGSRAYYCRSKTRSLCQTSRVDATVLTRFLHRESTAELFRPEQAMIPQQALSNDALSPHTPSPLPADADAAVTGTDMKYLADLHPQPVEWLWQHRLAAGTLAMLSGEPGSGKTGSPSPHCAAPNSISAFVAPKTENQVLDAGPCPLRRTKYPPVNLARCSNKLLEHLEHLRETKDLFGNLAKSQSEGR